MPPRGSDAGPDQTNLTHEEMFGKPSLPAEEEKAEETADVLATPETPEISDSPEEPELIDEIDSKASFLQAERSIFPDPFSSEKDPPQITLATLLEREFEDTYYKLYSSSQGPDIIEKITNIIMSRFSGPQSVRSFAKGFKSYYPDEVQIQKDELGEQLDKLENRRDLAADYKKVEIYKKIERLSSTLADRKMIGNEIAFYLNELADDWDKKLASGR